MAQIWNEHNGEPVNDSERIVVRHLQEKLPDEWFIVPSIQIPYHAGSDEIDAIVIGPKYVVVVEIKGHTGLVIFKKQEHKVNGEKFSNPVSITGMKAKRLAGMLAKADPSLKKVWVTSQVILAKEPKNLHVDSEIQSKVTRLRYSVDRLMNETAMVPQRITCAPVPVEKVLAALGVRGSAKRPSGKYGVYRTKELLSEDQSGKLFLAEDEITHREYHLRLHSIDPYLSREEREKLKQKVLKGYIALTALEEKVGWVPEIVGPFAAKFTETGDVFTVSPVTSGVTLADLLETGASFEQDVCLSILRDVGRAVQAAHKAGIAHRLLDPSAITVDLTETDLENPIAQVSAWDRASLADPGVRSTYSVVFPSAGSFVAPEALGEYVENWQTVDLFSLGKIVQQVWEGLQDESCKESMPPALSSLVEILCQGDPAEREVVSAFDLVGVIESLLGAESEEGVSSALIEGRYELRDRLGEGATGEVFVAKDNISEQMFALKMFRSNIGYEIAKREFGILLQVAHKNIVRVHDMLFVEGVVYLKMELLTGNSLRDRLDSDGPIGLEVAVGWFGQLLEALEVLHSELVEGGRRFVHRDLKPENLVVEGSARGLVLVDFGLASSATGEVAGGTARYRSVNDAVDAADPSMGLFALAVIFHEAVTGSHPFEDSPICKGDPVISDEVPVRIKEWLAKALSSDRVIRFSSATEMRSALFAASEREDVDRSQEKVSLRQKKEEKLFSQNGEVIGSKIKLTVFPGSEQRREAESPSGEVDIDVEVTKATIEALPSIRLNVEYCVTDYGEAWIRAVDAFDSPKAFHRLTHGLRPGIRPVPGELAVAFMELRQAQIVDDPNWPKIRKVPLPVLDDGAGGDMESLLLHAGGVEVGTREAVYGETNSRKTDLCVTFNSGDSRVPFVAYALTRVAPLVDEEFEKVLESPAIGLPFPDLDMKMAHRRGGMHDSYLDDFGYWACHEKDSWRSPRFPFGFLRTALFGNMGARSLFAAKGKLEATVQRFGPPSVVVVRLGDQAIVTDGSQVACVLWKVIPEADSEGILAILGRSQSQVLSEEAFEK